MLKELSMVMVDHAIKSKIIEKKESLEKIRTPKNKPTNRILIFLKLSILTTYRLRYFGRFLRYESPLQV